ncbi:MAG: hypothetical protein FD123_26 [Bacteroidetes bacterium]|nr:MAG: hypothetical protein FD123_26 [Bacteroidota bacterium]
MQDKLAILLKTLDRQEKRYVRLFLERPGVGGENYRQLYAVYLDANKNEQPASQKKSAAKLAVTRHLLYGQVLKALRLYHAGRSAETRLAEGIAEIDILFEKKLPDQCGLLLRRLTRLSGPHIRPQLRIELLVRELRLLHARQDTRKLSARYGPAFREQMDLLEEMQQMLSLQKMSYESFLSLKKHWLDKKNDSILEKIEQYPAGKLKSLQGKIIYGQVLSARQFSAGKSEAAFRTLTGMAKLFTKHPRLQQAMPNQYIALLNNLNVLLVDRGTFDAALENATKLRAIDTRSKEKNMRIRERVINVEQNIYRRLCDIPAAREALTEAIQLVDQGLTSPVYQMLFLLDAFVLHFMLGEFRAALRYLNRLLNKKLEGIRPDITRAGRLFNLFVHYELGHEDLLDRICDRFVRDGKMDNFEKAVVSFFRELPDRADKRKAFGELEKELALLSRDVKMKENYIHKFDLVSYARSKATGKPLLDILKENNKSKKHK